ncbi:hypothetical protein [Variovorax sp. UMC13]|uniref:hypothetical protein n=1 Tax=Variovorax sp. UMC13 TaxID=1862326 RepID=UPI0016023A16|nr:hypothetical protein [Variovorax sp. UMC13]MBB1601060.1 hypothetical protein [Variovorax sp. UMC13]
MGPGFDQLLELFNLSKKNEVSKFCRQLTITRDDLYSLILGGRAGVLEPYRYACHFDQLVPATRHLTDADLQNLSDAKVGVASPALRKVIRKVDQAMIERRLFAAHLFYVPGGEHWHLLYFDQRDRSRYGNHWKQGGPHIHYVRDGYVNEDLRQMWAQVCARPPRPPSGEHIRLIEQ